VRDSPFARGARLFDAGAFFDAHEAWEERWLVETNEVERRLLQGLIQIAAAFHKLIVIGSADSASRLLAKGLAKLDASPSEIAGMSVCAFREAVRLFARDLAAGHFARSAIPKIELDREPDCDPDPP
jgi:predicted metal-dependent hydrolase